jgi:hypothetical protein
MTTIEKNLIETYFELLVNLSEEAKLNLIEKIEDSIKRKKRERGKFF